MVKILPRRKHSSPWPSAVDAGFLRLLPSSYEKIKNFYGVLERPLSDLNPLMMLVWRTALSLHYLIEDEVLYVVANWRNQPVLWGPPIGKRVGLKHIRRAFELLRKIDPRNRKPVILYFSEDYALWQILIESREFILSKQSNEYIYDVKKLASLSTPEYKKKRNSYNAFKVKYHPTVHPYSPKLAAGCIRLLDRWAIQKEPRVRLGGDKRKFELERFTCAAALREGIPLSGVVATVEGEVQAFSIGTPHGRAGFNCMFEKTNLDMRGASAFIFPEFARSCLGKYSEINAGEDWGIEYLAKSKRLWKPYRTQPTYSLCENLVNPNKRTD